MKLNLEPSDYAKIALVSSAIVFVIAAVLACSWWNSDGFGTSTNVAIACAGACAVFVVASSWFLARCLRAERMENVNITLKYVPGKETEPQEPEKPATVYKNPKH